MSENLIIFGENNRLCINHKFFNSDKYSLYCKIVTAYDDVSIRGFNDVDILFLYGWWRRSSSKNILEILEVYIFTGRGIIIGEKEYIPSYLIDRYILKTNKVTHNFNSGISRFEILDL